MSAPYKFRDKLRQGKEAEARIDALLAPTHTITKATPDEEWRGIDRHLVATTSGRRFTIEYKADWTARATHNAFVETISSTATGREGWAVTSQADWLAYLIPDEVIYVIRMRLIKAAVPGWQTKYPTRRIPNEGYETVGLLVPLDEFERLAANGGTVIDAAPAMAAGV